jgi:hypothetical protein
VIRCTAKNRLLVRLRRLREPRYLIGGVVGAAYFYFSFFARFRTQNASASRRRARGAPVNPFVVLSTAGPGIAGLLLMIVTAMAWLVPLESGLLDFSKAEVQFLFPAPVSRRSLLIHRLMRSQLGMLFGALIGGLVAPSASGVGRLRIGIGVWLLLCTGKIFFTGVSLARARLTSQDAAARLVARLPLAAILGALAVVGAALYQRVVASPVPGPREAFERIGEVSSTGVTWLLMWPFVALARPMFAPWPGPFLVALLGALLVLAAVTVWVLQSDATFEDAARQVAEAKDQQPKGKSARYRARAVAWTLSPTGRPEMAFVWKAAMQTFRVVDVRLLVRLVAILFALSIVAVSAGQRNGLLGAFAMFALTGAGFAMLLAPQAVRLDMRQDLQHLELMKTWPLRPADVVRGELLWPGALITALAWTLIAFATLLSGALFARSAASLRISIGLAVAVLAPGLAFAQLAIHNGMALLFPAWVTLGSQRARGFDAMGQRIITLAGSWFALIVMALPGAVAGGVVWFAMRVFVGSIALVAGAAVCSAVLLVEVLVMTELLGPAYERLDLLAVERPE